MTIRIPETRKSSLTLLLWWLSVAYSLALVLHPFLIGCGCAASVPEHTCGIVQYYAVIGSGLCTLLFPAGIWLFRNRENMLIFLTTLLMIQLLCILLLLFAPALSGILADSVTEFVLTIDLNIPLVPYVGLLPLMGKTAAENSLYTFLFFYTTAAAVFAIHRYRRRSE